MENSDEDDYSSEDDSILIKEREKMAKLITNLGKKASIYNVLVYELIKWVLGIHSTLNKNVA